jgi:general secretion pathway protein K
MALLITVMTVTLLVAVTLQFRKSTWNKYLASHSYQTGVQLTAMADSGINIALAVLENDVGENEFDSFLEDWALLERETFAGFFPNGQLHIRIQDLSGRLPINNLVGKSGEGQQGVDAVIEAESRKILFRLLLSGAFPVDDETEAQGIVDAIVDWIDSDDKESDFGAESNYYQGLEPPYVARNRPLQRIEELLLIKGITPALLFGSGKRAGLADFLTVYTSDGKINVNTAPPLLIQSLEPLISEELVAKLDTYRKDKDNEDSLGRPDWYQNISGWPGDIVLNPVMVTTKSSYFEVIATGISDTLSRKMVADVERKSPDEINVLVRKIE